MLKQLNGGQTLCYLPSFSYPFFSPGTDSCSSTSYSFSWVCKWCTALITRKQRFCNLAFAVNRIQLRREESYKERCWVHLSLLHYLVSSVTYNIWRIVECGAVSQYIGLNGQKSKPKPESIISSFKLEFQFHEFLKEKKRVEKGIRLAWSQTLGSFFGSSYS